MTQRWWLVVVLWPLVGGLPLAATSYVPMSDEALFDQSPIIAEVLVQKVEPVTLGGRPYVDYHVWVERLYKGQVAGATQVVRVLGGTTLQGLSLLVHAAPRFEEGERAILFLDSRSDGTLGVVQFMLGAFHERSSGGRRVALRNLRGAREISPSGSRPGGERAGRDFEKFGQWLLQRATGLLRPPDYYVEATTGLQPIADEYTLFGGGLNLRWFDFDSSTPVTWRAHQSGVSGMAADEFAAFQGALDGWNDDLSSNILLAYGGTTTASGGLTTFDAVNTILWDDPNGEILGAFNCFSGGVLAIGGPWSSGSTGVFNGTQFVRILGGDVVTQNDAGCFFNGNSGRNGEEVFAHEVGHALGIAHACGDASSGACDGNPTGDNDALMRAVAHGDGRGAALGVDDMAAAFYLYGISTHIFADGFESGATTSWSSSQP